MRSFRSVLILAMAAGAAFAADLSLPDCFPPGTKVVFGMSLRSLLDSPTLKSFSSDIDKMSADMMKGFNLSSGAQLSGFNPLKDVDDVIVASTAEGAQPATLMVLRGRFDPKHMPGVVTMHNGIPIFSDGKNIKGAIAVLGDSIAIMGDMPEVTAALDRQGAPTGVPVALAEHVGKMAGRFDFWGVGDLPNGYHAPAGPTDSLNSVDRFEFGASLRNGLEITGEIHSNSPKDAEKMAETMKMIEAMWKQKNDGTKIDLHFEDGTIKFAVAISEEELKKSITAQKNLLSAATKPVQITGATDPDKPAPPAPAPAHPKGVIVKTNNGDTLRVTLPGGH